MSVNVKSLSRVRLYATPWTTAHQAPLPMGFSRQEYWSGLPLKDTIKKVKKQSSEWEKIFANNTSDKTLVFRTCKDFYNSIMKEK